MKTSRGFQMKVVDVFFLEDKTIFVGELSTESSFLGPVGCRLIVNDEDRGKVELEGENLFRPDLQSVWTRIRPRISREEVLSGESWLRSIE